MTYQLWRPDPAGLLRGEYLATSTGGGVTFGPNIRISDGLYLFKRFASDYDEPAIGDNRLHAIWADATPTSATAIRTGSGTLAPIDRGNGAILRSRLVFPKKRGEPAPTSGAEDWSAGKCRVWKLSWIRRRDCYC